MTTRKILDRGSSGRAHRIISGPARLRIVLALPAAAAAAAALVACSSAGAAAPSSPGSSSPAAATSTVKTATIAGVAGRHQLRDVIASASTPASADESAGRRNFSAR